MSADIQQIKKDVDSLKAVINRTNVIVSEQAHIKCKEFISTPQQVS